MSEQYPLLCEEFSDEDKFSPRFQRRRPMNLRGRAKNHVKGAAAIMTRWPDHWTSILTYWWIGLGMIALTTFIIYNTVFSIALLQPTNTRPIKYADFKSITHTTKASSLPGVFMHVFADNKEDGDLNKYMPYIEVFSDKYKYFTYNLIIVSNDTNEETRNCSDKTNNDIALNSLWASDVNYGNVVPSNLNIKIKYTTLTKYLNESPMKEYWKKIPYQFIPFLVRAISVWDRGGIAINPTILTPESPHASYVEKFVSIIKNFKKNCNKKEIAPQQDQPKPIKKHSKISPKFNNIRDIINALENEETSDYLDKEVLHALESRDNIIETNKENTEISIVRQDKQTERDIKTENTEKVYDPNIVTSTTEVIHHNTKEYENDSSSNLLPSFVDYLFHNEKTVKKRRSPEINEPNIVETKDLQMRNFWNDIKSTDYKPMIVSATGIKNNTAINNSKVIQDNEKLFDLTVDLKGNVIATETPCHAFIGTVFANVMHHDESETLTDFIIKELSLFCKGLLASCMGIDVILV